MDFSLSLVHVRRSHTHCHLGSPKSGKMRSVVLCDEAAAPLDRLSRREHFTQRCDLVFCDPTGTRVHEGDLRRRFYAALRMAGLGHKRDGERKMKFNDLHHKFGTLAVQKYALSDVKAFRVGPLGVPRASRALAIRPR